MASTQADSAGQSSARLLALRFYVADLDRSVDYYKRLLGMSESGRSDGEVQLSYGDATGLGLTLVARSADAVETDSTYAGHAVSVPDRLRVREDLIQAGYEVTDPAPPGGPVMRSFGTDPDGNGFEFGEFTANARETSGSLPGFGFFVADLDRSVDYYTRLLGMRESGRIESSSGGNDPTDPLNGMTKVYFTYGDAPGAPMLSIVWSPTATAQGPPAIFSTFAGLSIAVSDVRDLAETLEAAGYDVSQSNSGASATTTDPDGNQLDLVQPAR
jgi:catechol 2,3-dioxygenase-like lactoylglutathione lyase family enzyme